MGKYPLIAGNNVSSLSTWPEKMINLDSHLIAHSEWQCFYQILFIGFWEKCHNIYNMILMIYDIFLISLPTTPLF